MYNKSSVRKLIALNKAKKNYKKKNQSKLREILKLDGKNVMKKNPGEDDDVESFHKHYRCLKWSSIGRTHLNNKKQQEN